MNILVTGANGFLGSNICNLLSKEHNIFAVSRRFDKLDKNNSICIQAEMSNYIILNDAIKNSNIDILIHCAWMGGNSSLDVNELWQIENINYSKELLEICKSNNIKHFIGFGSSAEFGEQYKKFNEETICTPNTMYGVSKNCFKQISETFCRNNNISHTWIRPVYTYGPNDVETRLIPKTILSLLRNQNLTLNKCSSVIDYLFVQDFALAIKTIVEEKLPGSFVICSDQEIQVKNVVELIYNKIKPNCKLIFDENKSVLGPSYVCGSSEKLKFLSGWQPTVDLEYGLEQTISYYKKFV